MSSIDSRIVEMKFNNAQFEKGVKETTSSLDKLKGSLNLDGARQGLEKLKQVGANFNLSHISDGIDMIAQKFTALKTIGVVAMGNLTSAAVQYGTQMAKSLTIDPIKAGFDEYELKMKSIQTVLANTARYGTKLSDVTKAFDELNNYADKTIYNFGDMTKNIGLFTNAGIRIEDATSMIKGFSNAAAASGTGAQEAAGAAYQLSQALSAGTIRLMDWKSLTNAGMGNKNMQQGLIDVASAMGTLSKNSTSATEIQGNFNASLEKNWLSADVMSNYLKIMAGDMTEAEMAALHLTKAQIAAFKAQQKTAEEAATKVRTYTQLVGVMRESVGSGWSETFGLVIGDFDSATKLWTTVNNTLGPMINASGDARNAMLKAWAKLGGRDVAIDALTNAFKALMAIVKPIKDAFTSIFPATTGQQLYMITVAINKFAAGLIMGAKTSENLKRTFRGLFALLDIGWMILKKLVGVVFSILAPIGKAGGGVLAFTGNIGDFIVMVRDSIKYGNGLTRVFQFIGDVLKYPIMLMNKFTDALFRNNTKSNGFAAVWENISNAFRAIWTFIKPAVDWFVSALSVTGQAIANFFKEFNFDSLIAIVNTGLLGGLVFGIIKFINWIRNTFGVLGLGIVDQLKGIFGTLKDTLGTLQTQVKSKIIREIAIALAILAGAILILSFIDAEKLGISLGAITVMLGQLLGSLWAFQKVMNAASVAKIAGIAFALTVLSVAMLIFSSALMIMAKLDWNELARGLSGMAAGIVILVGASKLLAKETGKMVAAGFGILVMSTALLVLSQALQQFASVTWDELWRGITALTAVLAIIGIFSKVMGGVSGLVSASIGLLIISGAMIVLAGAIKIYSLMSWEEIAKGMVALAGSLAILAIGLNVMSSAIPGALALIVASVAITVLAGALKILGTMSWDDIGRGLVVLAGSLAILALAMYAMQAALPGAAALIVAAFAIAVLAPALILLGKMSWSEIGQGLTMLGAALAILAVGGVLLIAALPGLLGLGIAAVLIGIGALAAGAGVLMLAAGLTALSGAVALGKLALIGMVTALIGLIPLIMQKIGEGIIAIAAVISTSGPTLIAAFVTVLTSLVTAIATVAPLIINTLFDLIMLLVTKLRDNVPKFVDAGMQMINGILVGIANNIGGMVTAAANIIVNFVNGIAGSLPKIIAAGINLVLSFINGVATGLKDNAVKLAEAGSKVFRAIVDGVTAAIRAGGADLAWAGGEIGKALLDAAKAALGIKSPSREFYKIGEFATKGLVNGLKATTKNVAKSGSNIGNTAIDSLKKSLSGISDTAIAGKDMTPMIRPVLDLSAIKKDSTLINGMLAPATLSVDAGYAQASSISATQQANAAASSADTASQQATAGSTNISFVQNNTSPKALTASEIYRQTMNQISTARGVVATI